MTREVEIPTENWPKTFLLQLHEQAVQHGFVWVENISEEEARSLRARMYRIRRRSDKSMAAFITPEYLLVTIGQWDPEAGGRIPIIYNTRPDGRNLPTVRIPDGAEVAAYQPPIKAPPPPVEPIDPAEIIAGAVEIGEEDIHSFVADLKRKREERSKK